MVEAKELHSRTIYSVNVGANEDYSIDYLLVLNIPLIGQGLLARGNNSGLNNRG